MPTSPSAVAPGYTLDTTLGFELLELGPERASGRFAAEARVKQPLGLVHGGAFAAFAESLASAATYEAVASDGLIAVGLSNHTSFLRPILTGIVHADGRRRHGGRTTWLWEVDFSDDEGNLCAVTRVTLALRPAPQA